MFYFWKIFDRRKSKIRCLTVFTFVFFIAGVLLLDCFCSDRKCSWNSSGGSDTRIEPPFKSLNHLTAVNNFSDEDLDKRFDFNPDVDVFVFLHIQKTGGTNFGLHLVKNTSLKEPCICFENRKRCDCRSSKNYIWLISRHSTGWVCGLHADWTELNDCVPGYLDRAEGVQRKRRYLYFTILRDPLQRYLSEWKHVQRGSTWVSAKLKCGGRRATRKEVPLCFKGSNWIGVTFDEFTSCDSNLAHNRQTRMASDLGLVGCYDKGIIPETNMRDGIMLQSAKDNLRSMVFFGLTEYQVETSFLFEYTFGIKFTANFSQFNETRASKAEITSSERDRLLKLNALDVEFYSYARDLFLARVLYAKMQLKYSRKIQQNGTQQQNFQQFSQQNQQINNKESRHQVVTSGQAVTHTSVQQMQQPAHFSSDGQISHQASFSKYSAFPVETVNNEKNNDRLNSVNGHYNVNDGGYDYNDDDDDDDDDDGHNNHYRHGDDDDDNGNKIMNEGLDDLNGDNDRGVDVGSRNDFRENMLNVDNSSYRGGGGGGGVHPEGSLSNR